MYGLILESMRQYTDTDEEDAEDSEVYDSGLEPDPVQGITSLCTNKENKQMTKFLPTLILCIVMKEIKIK